MFSYDFEAEYWYSQHLKVQLTGDFSERISLGHVDTAGLGVPAPLSNSMLVVKILWHHAQACFNYISYQVLH